MATLAHSSSDAPQRQLNGTEPKVHHLDTVACLLPRLEPAHSGTAAARGTTQTKECQRVLDTVAAPRDPTLDLLLDLDGQVLIVDPEGGIGSASS